MTKAIKIAATGLAAYLVISILVAQWIPVRKPSDVWVMFGGLALIGILAAAAYLWFELHKTPVEPAEVHPSPDTAPDDELAQFLREAEEKLSSSQLGQNARFNSMPVVFLTGNQGAAKTTAMLNSGLDPELLVGQVYQGNVIPPTRFANLWHARQTVFIEPGDPVLSDSGKWSRLIRRMRPGKLAAGGSSEPAPRAAVVCFSCETLLKPDATEAAAAAARSLHAKLTEMSTLLGISLPVYVLLTKADRISFFHDYFHTLTNDEAAQVLGVTLPKTTGSSTGGYSAEQTARLTSAFDNLYLRLCERRLDFLERENDTERLPGTYEFPREFSQTGTLVVQFLVDLCRPTELSAGPFLRGFYFCGVRPIFIRESIATQHQFTQNGVESERGSGIFRLGRGGTQPQQVAVADASEVRKVPQWVFLNQFFSNVLLADYSALMARGTGTKASPVRRILPAFAIALSALCATAFSISYAHNRRLVNGARDATAGISSTEAAGPDLASLGALQHLEALRQSVVRLARYHRTGAPLSFRFGLYQGDLLYPKIRALYSRKFQQLLLAPTQQRLLANMRGLPVTPPSGSCEYPYDSLKMHLITTSDPDKSTKGYLAPKLLVRWSEGRDVDAKRLKLARAQFDFYSEERKYDSPSESDSAAVKQARAYLANCANDEHIYHAMLADVNSIQPSLNFTRDFKGSQSVVINNLEIAGAFTRKGWAVMQDKIKNADFSGDDWVLGGQSKSKADVAKLQQYLLTQYSKDYIDTWRDYVKKTRVGLYSGIPDAAQKLKLVSSSRSPLLALFCVASQNTEVDAPEVTNAFKPVHAVVPLGCENQYVGAANQQYVNALAALQSSLEQIGPAAGPNDPKLTQASTNAASALQAARQMAQTFGVEPETHLESAVQKLLEDPILHVTFASLINSKIQKELCGPFKSLMSKYPFNPHGSDASLEEVNDIFKPAGGLLWKFYDADLKPLLPKQGSQYSAVANTTVTLTPAFVMFFNRAATFSGLLYGSGPTPAINYSLKPVLSDGSQEASITIDGQTVSFKDGPVAKDFIWPGSQQGVTGSVESGGAEVWSESDPGLWGVFKFFAKGQRHGAGAHEWKLVAGVSGTGQVNRIGSIQVEVNPPTFPPSFPNLSCPATIAQ